jgi:thiosulfate/3-mercaptopyruvate sulfurtransferase
MKAFVSAENHRSAFCAKLTVIIQEVALVLLRHRSRLFLFVALLFLSLGAFAQSTVNPWSDSQTVQPAALNKELSDPKTAPTVLFVGFQRLYTAGHIKGAQFHGSGGSAEGLPQIKAWASPLPRSTNIVIYCGCCPMEHCPNMRPAFKLLRDLGFNKVRALILPNSFEADWAEKGLPYDKGQ